MAAPTLIVGLGGTGSKIVKKVSLLATAEQKKKIGFVVFDTDINELQEIQKENPFINTVQTSTKLSVGEYLEIDTHARDNWFPVNPILNSKTLTEGAGQVRAISRLALETAIRAGNMEPLHKAIEGLYKLEEKQSDQALRVIIVSSLAGGTGSGLILPVALYIKNFLATRFQQSANITRGFFILPEVFYEVIKGQAERNNLRCNAYATLRELDAFLMKGDCTLPDKYKNTVKYEFPRVGSAEFEEYQVRPYDFCFLFDAQNTEGKKLNSFNQYLDHAANCIYSQSIGPMNKRSNSSEDNTIRELCAQSGRNRYAGAGCSMLIYPFEDVKKYIALKWAQECVSKQWLVFDDMYKEKCVNNAEMRAKGLVVKDAIASKDYIESIEQQAKQKNPFALAIVNQCSKFDEDGLTREANQWELYIDALKKFVHTSVDSQEDLNSHRGLTMGLIGEIQKGKDVKDNISDAYSEMEKYRKMIEKRCDDTARTIAFSIFKAKNDAVTKEKHAYQLETYLRDGEGKFIHPNAVRFFLYNTLEILKGEQRSIDKKLRENIEFFDTQFPGVFDNPKTDETEGPDDIGEMKGKVDAEKFNSSFRQYMRVADEYRFNGIFQEVVKEGIDYVSGLCDAFQSFYDSFKSRIEKINKETTTIHKKYNHAPGKTTRYICASAKCLDHMLDEMPYTGSTVSIDSDLADAIYSKVRAFSMLKDKPGNDSYFSEIFESGIIGYFSDKLMQTYGSSVDMDILDAIEKEAEYERGCTDQNYIEQYVKEVIEDTRKLSTPFIERPLGEQKAAISACTYSDKLDPKDDSPRSDLISHDLRNNGGEPHADIGRNMIMFYQSIYGLRANGLSKFAPDEGEYYKAYYELISQIKPKSDKTPVITPHIDRHWHIISNMPDLDDSNQVRQENRIYKAFMLGLINNTIMFTKISEGKYLYKLYLTGCEPEDFVVSNGTPCDHFYEVLDALTINPVVVTKILEENARAFRKELNSTSKPTFETSQMQKKLSRMGSKEFAIKDLTLFDIPALIKVSSPSADFEKTVGTGILRVMFSTIYDYMSAITAPTELDNTFGKFIYEQYLAFDKNIDWYLERYSDNFSGYFDDLIRIALEELDKRDLDELYETMNEHRREARDRRE